MIIGQSFCWQVNHWGYVPVLNYWSVMKELIMLTWSAFVVLCSVSGSFVHCKGQRKDVGHIMWQDARLDVPGYGIPRE